ncbi:hypothetical protein OHB53_28685 [Streptomyces sp. NBC_00056]|uniref:hypothetical protein n=1 Tax=Streptomyces sp. NBC_00056 TaxID=2975633 RepID=UPI003255513E
MDSGKTTITEDERYFYSDKGAVGRTGNACVDPRHPEQSLFTVIQAEAPDIAEDAQSMKKLITSYTEAVEKSDTCR